MTKNTKYFTGYATKFGVKCSDGRVIQPSAFKHQNGSKVPLVWQHLTDGPENILGYVMLKHTSKGMESELHFNHTPAGEHASGMVEHGDLNSLSINAIKVKQIGNNVIDGTIKEVSLVLVGANPEAKIDPISIVHGDDIVTLEDEFLMEFNDILHTADDNNDPTVGDVLDTLTKEQQMAVDVLVDYTVEEAIAAIEHANNEGDKNMAKKNAFEHAAGKSGDVFEHGIDIQKLFDDVSTRAKNNKTTFMHELTFIVDDEIKHAGGDGVAGTDYGIGNIELLFPEYKALDATPQFLSRRMEWVNSFLSKTRKSPFSSIKTIYADITADEARAKGYITGNQKFEEVFPIAKRETAATTIYKKQKLDRDQILEITSFDVVKWLLTEMRIMLEEEIARACIFGDGRAIDHKDKVNEAKIRPIVTDDELFVKTVILEAGMSKQEEMETIMIAMNDYKGSGSPTLYTTRNYVTELKLMKNTNGNYLFDSMDQVTAKMGVTSVTTVEVMEKQLVKNNELVGVIFDEKDYTIGTNQGGEITSFNDFDIDFNQYKYLMETRMSGALTKIKSALVVVRKPAARNVQAPKE